MMNISYYRLADFLTWMIDLLSEPEPDVERIIINLCALRHNLALENEEQRDNRAGKVSHEWIPKRK